MSMAKKLWIIHWAWFAYGVCYLNPEEYIITMYPTMVN